MEREIMKKLAVWKDLPDRKPLLLTGVRQCGKTYVLKEFGNRYFEDTAYFSFEGNKGLASVFDYDLDPERILRELGSVVRGRETCKIVRTLFWLVFYYFFWYDTSNPLFDGSVCAV